MPSLLSLVLYLLCHGLFVINITYDTVVGFDDVLNHFTNSDNLHKTETFWLRYVFVFFSMFICMLLKKCVEDYVICTLTKKVRTTMI